MQRFMMVAALVLGMLQVVAPAGAVKIQSYSAERNDRFYDGPNRAFAGDGYDWSGVARSVDIGKWAAMISPSYFISANHFHSQPGETLRFYQGDDLNGPYEDHVVTFGQSIPNSDLWVGKLGSSVSSAVEIYPVLDLANSSDYLNLPVNVFGRPSWDNTAPASEIKMHMGLSSLYSLSSIGSASVYSWSVDDNEFGVYTARYAEGGDSGGSSFIVSDGVPTVVGTHWYSSAASFIPGYIDEINAVLALGGESLTVQTNYVAPPPAPLNLLPPASDSWKHDASGGWATPIVNWVDGGVHEAPNGVGHAATFAVNLSTSRTVSLDEDTTLGAMTFNDTDATGQGTGSTAGYQIDMNDYDLTLDTGTAGFDPADLVLIDVPNTNRVGHRIIDSGGRGRVVLTDNTQFNIVGASHFIEFALGRVPLAGSGDLLKTGRGQLNMYGNSYDYHGDIRIEEGRLQARNSNKALGNGSVTLVNDSGANLSFNGFSAATTFANDYTWEQVSGVHSDFSPFYVINTDLTWAGDITSVNADAGDGSSLSVHASPIAYGRSSIMTNLTGDNSGLKFAAGKGFVTPYYLGVGSANALGAGNTAYVQLAGHAYLQAGLLATAPVAIASQIDVINDNNVTSATLGGNLHSGDATYSGLITLNANNHTSQRQVLLRAASGGTVIFDANSVIASGGNYGDKAPLTKVGGGRIELHGANTYLGATAVRSGELVVGHDQALGAGGTEVHLGDATTVLAPVRVASKGSENFGTYANGTVTGAATKVDNVTLASGDRVLVKDNLAAWKNGVYVVQGTTSTWVRDPAFDSAAEATHGVQVSVTSGSTNAGKTYFLSQSSTTFDATNLDWHQDVANPTASLLNNGVTIDRDIRVVANSSAGQSILGGTNTTGTSRFTGHVSLDKSLAVTAAAGGEVDFAGDISGSSSRHLTKQGQGQVTFSSAKSYTGTTAVTDGTLAVNSTLASSGVSVASGAKLQGIGHITHAVDVDGMLAPGNSIGTLTAGSVVFAPGGVLEIELGDAGASDRLDVLGDLDIADATLMLLGAADGSDYIIATYSTLIGDAFAALSGLPINYVVDYDYQGSHQIALVAVPEPTMGLFMALGSLLLIRRRHG